MKKFKVAIVGATGLVGRETLSIMAERKFPASEVIAIASEKSVGKDVPYGDKNLVVRDLPSFDFSNVDFAIFCVPTKISIEYVEKATLKGCIVIDNSSYYRTDPEVPLVVPEINAEKVKDYTKKKIITNANCATIQMIMALKPLHDYAKVKRVVVSTYQSVSGIGKDAMDELYEQTKESFSGKMSEPKNFAKQIAFNAIPQIDSFREDGRTIEEWKMQHDTGKILDKDIKVSATCVRIPVFKGHSESVNVEFEKPITEKKVRELLTKFPGVKVIDNPKNFGYSIPIEAADKDDVFVSRIRKDETIKNGISMWVVSDNIRKGAALNTVQIAEELIKYL